MKLRASSLCAGGLIAACGLAVEAGAQEIEVIYTKIPGHSTAVVPGALNGAGVPTFTEWRAMEDLVMRADGQQWCLKGRTQLTPDQETILVLGSGTSGTMFCQEDQPFQGGVAGEKYDFFDSPSPVSWDSSGNIGFSARAKGGSSSVFEKLVRVVGGVHTIQLQMGDPALGLTDVPGNPADDELFGNSMGSVQLLDDGTQRFVQTPITNCHSTRYPAFFKGNTSFRQSGVSLIDGETWDNFGLSDAGGTPDGMHWYAEGDTENSNTAIDGILAVDDAVVLREGSPVAGVGTPTMADVFFTNMLADGTWFSRGDDPADNDWAVRNGALVAQTGDPITPGNAETWGNTFSAFTGNKFNQWILVGNTSAGAAGDNVVVLSGLRVVVREGDPVDLDGNGMFDDDVFIGRFNNTLAPFNPDDFVLTDDMMLYFIANIRSSTADLNGNPSFSTPVAFLRKQLYCPADHNQDGFVTGDDFDEFVALFVDGLIGADFDGNGFVNGDDFDRFVAHFEQGC